MSSLSFGRQDVIFPGGTLDSPAYTLTASFVASTGTDVEHSGNISLKFVKKFSVYAYYTPGTGGGGNSLQYQVEINPFYYEQDPNNLFWAPIGKYVDVTGTWTEEKATFTSNTSTTALTQDNVTPLDIIDPSAARVRIKAKETIVGGSAGTVRFMIGSNTIN